MGTIKQPAVAPDRTLTAFGVHAPHLSSRSPSRQTCRAFIVTQFTGEENQPDRKKMFFGSTVKNIDPKNIEFQTGGFSMVSSRR